MLPAGIGFSLPKVFCSLCLNVTNNAKLKLPISCGSSSEKFKDQTSRLHIHWREGLMAGMNQLIG